MAIAICTLFSSVRPLCFGLTGLMASTSTEVALLGEPRLKNGLTYYPGVQTVAGSVLLGNVVRLQLQAEGAQPYIGFGFLKGLWLWRDQPYIRVQYMAPSRTDLPTDAIAYSQEPEQGAPAELMVTNRVGDLHLNALLGPVLIGSGPLIAQLFQDNVDRSADTFICERHLDPAAQRVQPLDEAFRLTPIVQAFPKTMLRALAPAAGGGGGAGAASANGGCAPAGACDGAPGGALGQPPRAELLPAGSPAASAQQLSSNAAASTPLLGDGEALSDGTYSSPAMANGRPAFQMPSYEPDSAGGGASYDGGSTGDAVPSSSVHAIKDGGARGFGPSGNRGAILLQATYRGLLVRPTLTMRCPSDRKSLYDSLAKVFGLVPTSVKVVYQSEGDTWLELSSLSELVDALEKQPTLQALPVHVSGEEMLHLPLFHVLSALIALVNLVAISAFAYFAAWLPQLEMPWIAIIGLPPMLLAYNGYAAATYVADEYVMSQQLRTALARKDGHLVALVLISLLGPDTCLLYMRLAFPRLGAAVSKSCERDALFWAAGLHILQDVPALLLNVELHRRMGLAWDSVSYLMLAASVASLTYNLAWHLLRMCYMRTEEDDLLPHDMHVGPSPSRTRRQSLRVVDTVKYVGLGSTFVVGQGALDA